MKTPASCLALLLAASVVGAQTPVPLPVAPVRPVSDTYFGTTVIDPYRWMENLGDPEVKTWLQAQADYTNRVLARLPGRAALLARIQALDNAGVSMGDVQTAGGKYFYRQTAPGDVSAKLCVRDGLHGAERVLLDPQALTLNGVHFSMDYLAPSPDGALVAVGVSPGGSEASTMRILKTADGSEVGERIDRTDYAAVSWNEDGKSFFYSRLQKLAPTDAETAKYQKGVAFLHLVGTDAVKDTPVFGYNLSPNAPFAPDDVPIIVTLPGCPYVFGVIAHGVQNENAVYFAPLSALNGAAAPWRRLADFGDDVVALDEDGAPIGLAAHGDDVYLLTHKNAPRYKIVKTSLAHPNLGHAETVVPASDVVIRAMAQAADALYVQDLDGGLGRLRRVSWGGHQETLSLPFPGRVYLITNPRQPGTLAKINSWTNQIGIFSFAPGTKQAANTGLHPPAPVDMSAYTSLEARAKSADGTLIPLSIICQKGLKLDGSHPTLLEGYGSYGTILEPQYRPTLPAWLERGGVMAIAHVRGGGEYGEDWHRAGRKQTKHHSWEDFIACGQYLIDKGYTTSARLAGTGTSAGGITVGRALTERPDLFAAILDNVGSSNPLRSELTANGPSNIPEFGTATEKDGFQALYAMDAYQHVKDGVRYPAVLLTTGINDPRVASWEPAKLAARLQAATAGGKPVLLRVDYDAGHGIGSTKAQRDLVEADQEAFLLWQFGDPAFQPAAPARTEFFIGPTF